jgi:hypothetical protein
MRFDRGAALQTRDAGTRGRRRLHRADANRRSSPCAIAREFRVRRVEVVAAARTKLIARGLTGPTSRTD